MGRTEVARHHGISPSKLEKLDAKGKGPPRIQYGRKFLYHVEKFQAWLEANSKEVAS